MGWLLALSYLGAISHPLLDLQTVYAVQLLSPFDPHWFHSDGLFIISPWLIAILALGVWRSRKAGAGKPAIMALCAAAAFIAVNVGISIAAWNAPAGQPDRVFAAPEPLWFWRRDMVWHSGGQIFRARFDPLADGLVPVAAPFADNMNDATVRRATEANAEVRMFLAWSQVPFAKVQRQACTVTVTFGDARFSSPLIAGGFTRRVQLPVQAAGCP